MNIPSIVIGISVVVLAALAAWRCLKKGAPCECGGNCCRKCPSCGGNCAHCRRS